MRKRVTNSLLLVAVLILSIAIYVHPIFLADTIPGYTWESRPQNYSATIAVTNPTQAYDEYEDTYASFAYSSGTGKFELYDFTVPTFDVVSPLPPIESVDFHMKYYAEPNTATSPDDQYRIMYYVDGTPAADPLVNWTYALRKDLYVNGFDNSSTDWTRVGSSPYLGAIDYPTNYIYEAMGVLLRPDNNGDYTDWSGDYTDWDDVTPDGNATYVSAAAPNLNESSTIGNPSLPLPTGTIQKVMVTINASNTVVSDDQLNITLVIDGTAYYGHQEIFAPSKGWISGGSQIESFWVENPATESPWTWTDINNLQVGVTSIQVGLTWDGEIRITQMFVEVFCVGAEIGDFSFEDVDPSFNVGRVELEIYARDMGPANNDMVEITVYNGSTWSSIGTLTPSSGWTWSSVVGPPGSPADVTTKLDTTTKINAAKVFLIKLTVDAGRNERYPAIEEIRVDAMRLRVYTEGYLEEPTWVHWLNQPKPGGGNWTWTDISNIQFAVETSRIDAQDPGCGFELYDAYVDVNLPNATVKVYPNSVIDYGLKPQPPKTIRPNGDNPWSGGQQWIGNYTHWDDVTPDNDTTYVSTTQQLLRESSNLEDPVHETWQIASVRVVAYAKYSTSGMDELFLLSLVFSNRYEYTSSTKFSLTTSYAKYSSEWAYNPRTNALWTWSDMDTLQAGVTCEGDFATGEMRVTQLYVEIIGPRFTVNVNAEDVVNLYTYEFILSYDTTALTAKGYLPGSPFVAEKGRTIEDSITAKTGEPVGIGNETKKIFYLPDARMMWGSETIYVGGVPQTRFTDYTIDYETVKITLTTAPGLGVAVTADYEIPARVAVTYQMEPGEEGASGNRTLGTIIFVVDGYGKSILDLHTIRLTDPLNSRIYLNDYDGYFRNTMLSDISGPSGPDHLPDGVVDNWDLQAISLAYGNIKNNTDPEWANYMIADISGPSGPDHLPDGVVDNWDLSYCGQEYGESV